MYYQSQLNVLSAAKAKKTGCKLKEDGEKPIECYQLQVAKRREAAQRGRKSEDASFTQSASRAPMIDVRRRATVTESRLSRTTKQCQGTFSLFAKLLSDLPEK